VLAADAEWPSFRGERASGVGTGSPPVRWNGTTGENVLFKTEIPGLGHSSPVVAGERIFVTTAVPESGEASLRVGLYGDIAPVDGEGAQSFEVLALERTSGEILWRRIAHHGEPEVKRHTKATHANPTPATDGEILIVSFGSEGLYAFDLGGELLWTKDFGVLDAGFFRVPDAQWGFASSPVIHDGKVLVQVDVQKDSFVAALDLEDGSELWRTPREEVPTWSTPTIAPYTGGEEPAQQLVLNGWKHIGGYDLESGRELWRMKGGGDIPVPTPVVAGEVILITSAHGAERPIYAVRTDARGDVTGSDEHLAWTQEKAGNYMQTPLVYDGLAYFCLDNGVLGVYDAKTGERLYQERLGGGASGFTSSPVAADGRVYFTSEDGDTYVLAAGRSYELLAKNELGETVMATPAIVDGILYLRGRSHLFALAEVPDLEP
jgi:outer membrane protein assembly factor BamB